MKKILLLLFGSMLALGAMPAAAQNVDGSWQGSLELGPQKLRIVFNITKTEEGYKTTMDSPDQMAFDIPVESTSVEGSSLKLSDSRMGMTYAGEVEGDTLKGTFTQGGMAFQLTLERTAAEVEKPVRPQTPEPPYPYDSEDVSFAGGAEGVTLAGTFTYPRGGGRFPAVVLVSGSGPQNRDEELLYHKPFLVLADYLTRNGIAVLRYDDRGVGSSTGDYSTSTLQDFASDALAALRWLATRDEVDSGRRGVIGHSEGCSVAFMLAANDPEEVAYIVSMAGAASPDFIYEQPKLIMSAMGLPEEYIEANREIIEKMKSIIEENGLENVRRDPSRYIGELRSLNFLTQSMSESDLDAQLARFASPELYSIVSYDAASDLRRIKCPVLAINGEKDLQIWYESNLGAIRANVGPVLLTAKAYPDLNHLFQHATTGLPQEYASIEETISPEVLQDIASWITEMNAIVSID